MYPNDVAPGPRPAAGQLWLARPPYLLTAHVLSVYHGSRAPYIEYELLDADGSPLTEPVTEVLGSRWWTNFQPLIPRYG